MIKPLLLAAAIMCFVIPPSFAQTTKRTIVTPPNNYPAPDSISEQNGNSRPTEMRAVSIVAVSVEGQKVPIGEPFEASKDWLKGLVVELENISNLSIKSVRLSFILPETKVSGVPSGFSLEYGKDLSTRFEKNEMPSVAPGEKIRIFRSEPHYQRDRQGIEKRTGISDFSEVILGSATVKFDNGMVWWSQRLPFADDKRRPEAMLDAWTNLIGSSDGSIGNWKVTGDASIQKTTGGPLFSVRNGASFTRDVAIAKNSEGKFVLLISRCTSERLEGGSITGLPYLYGRWMSGAIMLDQPLQGNRTLCELGEVNKWATSWGIFKIPATASSVNLNLNQAEGKGFPQNGSSARFSNVGMYIFDTEADAMNFVNAFNDRHR